MVAKNRTKIGFGPFSPKGQLNLLAEYPEHKKTECQNLFSSWSYKSLKFEFVCSQIPLL